MYQLEHDRESAITDGGDQIQMETYAAQMVIFV